MEYANLWQKFEDHNKKVTKTIDQGGARAKTHPGYSTLVAPSNKDHTDAPINQGMPKWNS